jgi:DNA-directed RNA polymerase subunit M/transcription elongation factor TFIIS
MAVDIPDDMIWPDFDRYSKCVKCGWEIAKPEPVAPKPVAEKPAPAKPVAKKETAAEDGPPKADGPPKTQMALPVQAPDPTCVYCNGEDCPMFEDEVDQHMHQFCDCCGYEWIAKTLDAS